MGTLAVAYLIVAYRSPEMVARLIDALDCSQARFVVHIDGKEDIEPFKRACSTRGVVWMEPRYPIHWGGFNTARAIMDCLRTAMAKFPESHRFVNLSGQCYPLMAAEKLAQRLLGYDGKSVFTAHPVPSNEPGCDLGRFVRPKYFDSPFRMASLPSAPVGYLHPTTLGRLIGKAAIVARERLAKSKPIPDGVQLYKGRPFLCLAREHAAAALEWLDDRPEVIDFFSTSFAPDEAILHTAVMNGVGPAGVIAEDVHFMRFRGNNANPDMLTMNDVDELSASGKCLCRKLDFGDPSVANWIDECLRI